MVIKLVSMFSLMQFARYLRIAFVENQVHVFDVSLLSLIILQALFISLCSYIGYKSIIKENNWYKYSCISYIVFIIIITICYKTDTYNVMMAESLFYIISSFTFGMMSLCGATFISKCIDLNNKYIGFQVGVFLMIIMVFWRISFFAETYVTSFLRINI
jgi:uncharacterized protein involved in response to NO